MCLCCHLLVKPWLSPQDLPTSKQPRLFYFPSPVLIFSQEIIGHKKQTEWVVRTCGLGKASFAAVPGEDWNCEKPCLACFMAMAANISVCGPWNFFQHASFAFFSIISFSHLTSPESKKCSGTPHSFLLPPAYPRSTALSLETTA